MTKPDPTDLTAALRWAATHLDGPVTVIRELVGGMTGVMLAVRDDQGTRAVLRVITEEPWRTHGAALSARESEVQRMLASSHVPAPRSLALDADGIACEHPAHLMTLLPGATDTDRADPASLAALARLLATIHDVAPTIEVRPYEPWAWESKFVVPTWAEHPDTWSAAFDLLRATPPPFEPVFIHRDFGPHNVLWSDGAISGVVDWVETSIGPAWLDVAHCSTNLALHHDSAVADAFARAYAAETGRSPDAYWDVLDVVGFLPLPDRKAALRDPADLEFWHALERRLVTVLPRVGDL
jgi:aminoglycoside phosphotransferase (APT) family kinase protein